MSAQACTLYGANMSVEARATAGPRSKTSGAVLVPALVLAASISCAEEPFGFCELTVMPYLAEKALMIAP